MNGPELRDIHLPDPVSWWPPGPGWWLLLVLLALLLAGAVLLRHWRRSARRRALIELRRLRDEVRAGLDQREAVDRMAVLLRRTLISYRGRDGYAGSCGNRWIAQMRELAPLDQQLLDWLGRERYRARRQCDLASLLDAGETWLKSLPREGRRVTA